MVVPVTAPGPCDRFMNMKAKLNIIAIITDVLNQIFKYLP